MFDSITVPTLLLDQEKCRKNIQAMAEKAARCGVRFRPHFKTHQSVEIGRWFRETGIETITVSSLRMAEYFAADGWKDITVAFPVNIREKDRINRLAGQADLHLVVENMDAVRELNQFLVHPVRLFIKADTGYHRTGLGPGHFSVIDQILEFISLSSRLRFAGFLTHAGHTYKASGKEEVARIHQESLLQTRLFRERYKPHFPDLIISYGDTPSCSIMDDFPGVDEIRPGNFVFYDMMQCRIHSCTIDQVAVAMACPVVAKHPERNEIVLYGGGVHFSKDRDRLPDGGEYYGMIVELTSSGWTPAVPEAYLKSLSQEHGIVHAPDALLEKVKIGSLLGVLPIHSCMTADLMKEYRTLEWERIGMMELGKFE